MDVHHAEALPEDTAGAAVPIGPDVAAMLGASPVASFLTGPEGEDATIAFANDALLALTGFDRDELIGRPVRALLMPRTERAEAARLDATDAATVELLGTRKDGSSYWGAFSVAPVPGRDGRAVYRLGQIVDVSRRRDAEDALLLSQQREALGLLTNSVAHEFNNFLQILIGYIDGLKRRLGEQPEPFVQRAISRSTEAAERAAVLTRQLLTHSRRIAPEVRPVALDALVTAAAESLRAGLPGRVSLSLKSAEGLPPALCNPSQVELALKHIVANAVEALEGEGRIEIATFAVGPGDGALQRGGGAVGIAIADTGHGMSPEMMARALAPFATSREAGRGAGLAIVHGLMKRQNGTISLDSRPGEGTTVRLVFPAAA